MNTPGQPELPTSRWVRETAPGRDDRGSAPDARERQVLEEVLAALRRIRFGSVTVTIQDGRPVQVETAEKKRL